MIPLSIIVQGDFLFKRFLKNESGSFAPIFTICLTVMVPLIGAAVDYTRVLSFEGKLQFAADAAMNAALRDSNNVNEQMDTANRFFSANMPGVEFQSKRSVENGQASFEVTASIDTPVLSMVGTDKMEVTVESPMYSGDMLEKGTLSGSNLTSREMRAFEREIEKAISQAPYHQQSALRQHMKSLKQNFSNGSMNLR